MSFGKAITGGAPINAHEVGRMNVDHLAAVKARHTEIPLEKTEDLLNQRVSEELDYSGRVLEGVENELSKRGVGGSVIARLEETEQILNDLSNIVDAKDRCAGIDRVKAPDMKRRLLRSDFDGKSLVCGPPDRPQHLRIDR